MSTELVVLQNITPLQVFSDQQTADALFDKIKAEAASCGTDVSTEEGRAAIKSMAYKIARSKTALDEMGKALTEEARKTIDSVNAERNRLKEKMQALQDDVRRPLTEFETREKLRVEEREGRIAEMSGLLVFLGHSDNGPHPLLPEIEQRLTKLAQLAQFEWQEFSERASKMEAEVRRQLTDHLENRKKYDADQAELARLRKEEEDRKAEAERKHIADEAAAKAKADAEAKAAEEARAAQEKADREKAELEAQKKAEADRAAAAEAAAKKAEEDRIAAAEKHKADLKAAEEKAQRDAEAAAQAERDRQAAEKKAEEDAAAKRAADLEHKRKINNDAVQALMKHAALDETQARAVIASIASGQVPSVKILY